MATKSAKPFLRNEAQTADERSDTRRILSWSHFELIRRSCSTLVADTTPGFRKVDTGQGDSSRGAPPCSIDPFRSTHDERVAYCLPALRRDQPCAAPTLRADDPAFPAGVDARACRRRQGVTGCQGIPSDHLPNNLAIHPVVKLLRLILPSGR